MYFDEHAIQQPDGYTLEELSQIAEEATSRFKHEQIEVWGNYNGIEISRDMVRQVLIVAELYKNDGTSNNQV